MDIPGDRGLGGDLSVNRHAEWWERLAVSWQQRAVKNRPDIIDTDGRMALSVMSNVYDACAREMIEAGTHEQALRSFKRRLTRRRKIA